MLIKELKTAANSDGLGGMDSQMDRLVRLAITTLYSHVKRATYIPWWMVVDTTLDFGTDTTQRLPLDFREVYGDVYFGAKDNNPDMVCTQRLPYLGHAAPRVSPHCFGFYLRFGLNPIRPNPGDTTPQPNPQGGENSQGVLMALSTVPTAPILVRMSYMRRVVYDQNFDDTELAYFLPEEAEAALVYGLRIQIADSRPGSQKVEITREVRGAYNDAIENIRSTHRPAQSAGPIVYSH